MQGDVILIYFAAIYITAIAGTLISAGIGFFANKFCSVKIKIPTIADIFTPKAARK